MPWLMCSFVVKALDASGHKVFMNICESEHVLSPSAWQQSEVRSCPIPLLTC